MSTKLQSKQTYHETKTVPVNQITKNNWNPNFVSNDIMESIKDDMTKNGFIEPIVLQKFNKGLKKKNVIINGEHRWQVWKDLGNKEIPAITLDIDDKLAKALTIRLNREHGELLPNRISRVLLQISKDRDIKYLQEMTNMREKDLNDLVNMRNAEMGAILDEDKRTQERLNQKAFNTKGVKCPQCGHEFILGGHK